MLALSLSACPSPSDQGLDELGEDTGTETEDESSEGESTEGTGESESTDGSSESESESESTSTSTDDGPSDDFGDGPDLCESDEDCPGGTFCAISQLCTAMCPELGWELFGPELGIEGVQAMEVVPAGWVSEDEELLVARATGLQLVAASSGQALSEELPWPGPPRVIEFVDFVELVEGGPPTVVAVDTAVAPAALLVAELGPGGVLSFVEERALLSRAKQVVALDADLDGDRELLLSETLEAPQLLGLGGPGLGTLESMPGSGFAYLIDYDLDGVPSVVVMNFMDANYEGVRYEPQVGGLEPGAVPGLSSYSLCSLSVGESPDYGYFVSGDGIARISEHPEWDALDQDALQQIEEPVNPQFASPTTFDGRPALFIFSVTSPRLQWTSEKADELGYPLACTASFGLFSTYEDAAMIEVEGALRMAVVREGGELELRNLVF